MLGVCLQARDGQVLAPALNNNAWDRYMQGVAEDASGRTLVLVRKVMSPQRDVVGMLARRGIPGVNERTTIYFRDVYDHLVRIYEQIDTNRDLLGNAMDAWLSVVANRTNDITKQQTILASSFLPMSFVVGFFGQNFDVLGQPPFFFVMLTTMAVIPVGMVLWFRHKEWW